MSKKICMLSVSLGLMLFLVPRAQADFSSASKNLSNSALASKSPKVCSVPAWGGVFVLWVETDGDNDQLLLTQSANAGATWTTPIVILGGGQILNRVDPIDEQADSYSFSFVVDDPYIHIVAQWRESSSDDYEIYYLRSPDLGESSDVVLQLTDNSTDSRFPDVAVRGEYVHVTYQDSWPGNEDILYKRINGYGAGAVDLTRRLTFSSADTWAPRIAVSTSGEHVNIVYMDECADGAMNVFYKHIGNSGSGSYQSWQLTFGAYPIYNGFPDIAVGAGSRDEYIYIVYQSDFPGNFDVIYKRLSNYGVGPFVTATCRLSYSATDSLAPSMDYDSAYDNLHITYHDSWPGNNDIMHKFAGTSSIWGGETERVSWGAGDSVYSSVAAAGAWANIVWSDNSSGNYEILFKYGI